MNTVIEGARRHQVEIVCAKCDWSGLENASPDDLKRVMQNAKVKIILEMDAKEKKMTSQKQGFYFDCSCNAGNPQHQVVLGKTGQGMSLVDAARVLQNAKGKIIFEDAEDKQVPVSKAHSDDEILAMYSEVSANNPGAQFYMNRVVSSYRMLCNALEKGGYSVADKDVAILLTQAEVMETVPVWKGISGTQEGHDLDAFLDKFRAETDAGFRVTEGKLKACLGGFAGRLALYSASLTSQPRDVSPDDGEKVMQNTSVRFVLKPAAITEEA